MNFDLKGRFFTIGEGKKVRLLCESRGVDKDGNLKGGVINGAWDFTLTPEGVLTVVKKGTRHNAEINWSGNFPLEFPKRYAHDGYFDYHSRMDYVEDRLQKWKVTNYVLDKLVDFEHWRARFVRSCRAAVRNFKVVFKANSRFVTDEDDLIPF